MRDQTGGYQVRRYPRARRLVIDACAWGVKKHTFHVVTEFDITTPKRLIQEHADATDVRLSFTAYIAACVGRAVAAQKICHAYRIGRRKLVLFDEVDIATLIDHDVEGERMATHYVIRGAERKPVRDIHDEIRLAQRTPVTDMPGVQKWKFYLELPGFLRRLFYWWLDRSPQTRKKLSGTVLLTAPGVFGVGTGWGIPISVTTLTVTVGGVSMKPAVVGDRIEPREFIDIVLSFDHDIVDGAPAARFATRLKRLVESGSLLTGAAPEMDVKLAAE